MLLELSFVVLGTIVMVYPRPFARRGIGLWPADDTDYHAWELHLTRGTGVLLAAIGPFLLAFELV